MNNREGGFSLVEVLVAMVILTVGVLGLVGSSAAISRMTTEGGRSGGSAAIASSRIERLRATPCASLTSGSETAGPFRVAWRVTTSSVSAQLRDVVVTVDYLRTGGQRSATYETQISCVPKA